MKRPRTKYLADLKVAVVHDWLTGMRGGEKCLHEILSLLPNAEIFTLFYTKGALSDRIESIPIHLSALSRLPLAGSYYRHLLPLFPRAVEAFDLKDFDAVLSISHCVAKGAIPPSNAPHLCYCLTPMRYVWDLFDLYFSVERVGRVRRFALSRLARRLRTWDVASSPRVSRFVAISNHVAERIARHYGRGSFVIYPPVDCARFSVGEKKDDFFLAAGAFAPYKRFDLAIQACKHLNHRLIVAGSGQDEARLRRLAGPSVKFVGKVSDRRLQDLYRRARAFIFPGEEDFGIMPVEANASGTPVVAFARGGATETIIGEDDPAGRAPTGVFFEQPTVDSLTCALRRLDRSRISPHDCRRQALTFDAAEFREQMRAILSRTFV